MFESFAMCSSIASCDMKANQSENQCGVQMTPYFSLFTDSASACSLKYEDGQYDGLCYHVPFEGYKVFNS